MPWSQAVRMGAVITTFFAGNFAPLFFPVGASPGNLSQGFSSVFHASLAAARKPASKREKSLSKEAIFAKSAPATVLIVIPGRRGLSLGSGVIIDPSGLIVTNRHVIDASAGPLQVFLYNPKERSLETNLGAYVKSHTPLAGQVVKRSQDTDLALVRLPAQKTPYPSLEFGNSDLLQIGQDVVAIGNPLGLTWTFTSGTISAIRKDAIQTETPINPGNSGGPLLDMRARLVGVNTYIRKDAQGLGFAIPVNTIIPFVKAFANNADAEAAAPPPGPTLSQNPVPLAALSISQDLGKLRALNGRRANKQTEELLLRDIDAAEELRVRMIKGELTVAQILPALAEKLQLMALHNQSSEDTGETRQAFAQQLEKTAEHLKQILQVSR